LNNPLNELRNDMLLDLDDSQLVLVDYQARLLPAIHDGAAALANAVRLAKMARLLRVPLFVTEENPAGLGSTVPELQAAIAQAGGKTVAKMAFSAVADGLGELLRPPARAQQGNARSLPKHLQKPVQPAPTRNSVVIAGCETHVCLLQTALELLEEEFDVWVVTDACASRSERNRDAAFDRLAGAGAELVTTEMVAFEWLRSAEHPAFKDVLALVK
jgi:nicotinamidase-related amidase